MIETVTARWKVVALGLAITLMIGGAVVLMAIQTRPTREAVAAYTALFTAANRQDIEAATRLCSARYLRIHPLRPADEGGIVGLPRNIHKNFQAWRQGPNIWVCPTNRVGPVYQFVRERDAWRFDGPVGLLRGRGEFFPLSDLTDEGAPSLDEPPANPAQPD
ncbi:hypothetical protein SAMN05444166_2305 [Singulisphaera sp. GP187]|uniref:hypothetical protein n=1 Tax=Singulisphaera sp. GP187 TaxID=1882752 RepID=UPI000929D01A|nr:hypothetical protein [Singulisphaera sp. GP187]SIO07234.1 hypothetical protein SAMN05444166_2305 [Singulisphaera sp. GP187]